LRAEARALTCKEVKGEEIQRLIRDMHETMHDAPGVGLAAPQVGLPQLAVNWRKRNAGRCRFTSSSIRSLFSLGTKRSNSRKGCLNLAGYSAFVPRARRIRVAYLDERGERQSVKASGWYARIVQHEVDHLHSALHIDRMRSRTFTSLDNWNRYWKGRTTENIFS
jgi:peptide deformylase